MSKSRMRSRLFVDAQVQGVLIRQLALHWAAAAVVMFLFLSLMQFFSTPHRLPVSHHANELWEQYGVLLVAMLVIFPVFVYDSIKLSNRFAGPMVSFRAALSKLAQGEKVGTLAFRKDDYWQTISSDFNTVAQRMNLLEQGASIDSEDPRDGVR